MNAGIISPYHLTSREAPAMAGLLLMGCAVTLLPASADAGDPRERERFEAACRSVPRYRELMEGWAWSAPLWRSGALGSLWEGEDASSDVRIARERIRDDDRFEALRAFVRDEPEDVWNELAQVARDLLKGGPDPSVSVPMAAGIDGFAARHGLAVVRPEAASLAQKSEARLGERRFAFAAPVLLEGEGDRVVEARERLGPELGELREAVERAWLGGQEAIVRDAARVYATAFETERATLARVDDSADERVIIGTVSVTGLELPADAVLRSSAHAAHMAGGRRNGAATATAPPATGERVRTLVVKVISR